MKTTSYKIGNATIEMHAPKIKTDFWFAENDRSPEDHAKTWAWVTSCENENYFIEKNMQQLDATRILAEMKRPNISFYTYEGKTFVEAVRPLDVPSYANPHKLSVEELHQLRAACINERNNFLKRLKKYLKRYGLSKCTFDTYWSER